MRDLKLLKIPEFDKSKVLVIHLVQCVDSCKCASYDYL